MPSAQKLPTGAIILLTLGITLQVAVLPAFPANRPVIDTDSPAYSHLTREILVSGYGLQPFFTYFVWLQKPGEARSTYTGVSFVATAAGGIPYPNVNIPLDMPPKLGTYILTVSTSSTFDTANAKCHFGVAGPLKPIYQRRETARFAGGGALPGSTVRIDIRNPSDILVSNASTIANELGEFEHAWPIPNNVQIGSWTVSIAGVGTFDNSLERHRADGQFGVTEASLRMSIHQQPLDKYQRTETARIAFIIKYPDDSAVTSIKQGSRPVFIAHMSMRIQALPLLLTDPVNGVWIAEYVIPRNQTLGKNYTFSISKGIFDDGFGNKGPLSSVVSSEFDVTEARLTISISTSKSTYEILFESVSLNVTVRYPDGSNLAEGKVSVAFEASGWKDQRPLLFHEGSGSWAVTYYLGIAEIQRLGMWKATLLVEDNYGNSGTASVSIGIQVIWLFAVVATSMILVMIIVKWVSEEPVFKRLYGKKAVKEKTS